MQQSPLGGEKPDFWPVSKFNTGSLPLRGILLVTKQTPNFRIYSRRVLYDLPQTLLVDRARLDHQKDGISF